MLITGGRKLFLWLAYLKTTLELNSLFQILRILVKYQVCIFSELGKNFQVLKMRGIGKYSRNCP